MFVVCGLLSVVDCSYLLLFVGRRLLRCVVVVFFVVRGPLFLVRGLLLVAIPCWLLLFVVCCCALVVVRCASFIVLVAC